jgi:uncharacterized membrane protein YkoI
LLFKGDKVDKLNVILIIVVVILVGLLGTAFGFMVLNKNTNNDTAVNQTPSNVTNITNQTTGSTIPYSPEYISFTKAKSIAKGEAAKGVVTSDPILIKAKNGNAVYYSTYSYNGKNIGGIIINAKTGAVISNQQNIPTTYENTNNNNYQDSDSYYTESDTRTENSSGS